MRIHVVSFQVPWPANYGGAIDVYYKLKALHDAGATIVLHTFCYGGRGDSAMLRRVADEVYFYRRRLSPLYLLSAKPFIVRSRCSRRLLARLAEAPEDEPVIFEGQHTTLYLDHPALRNRMRVVRAHNVEHDYYRALARKTGRLWERLYLRLEAWKLRRDEARLAAADAILTLSEADHRYFAERFGARKVMETGCFHRSGEPVPGPGALPPYILYHGNLSVAENIEAAMYIINEVMPLTRSGVPLVIAGLDPVAELREAVASRDDISLVASPDSAAMDALIANAAVNLMVTFQSTGIKLKLLETLRLTRGHCIANSVMAADSRLAPLCHIADSPRQQAALVDRLAGLPPAPDELDRRAQRLDRYFSPAAAARAIIGLLGGR